MFESRFLIEILIPLLVITISTAAVSNIRKRQHDPDCRAKYDSSRRCMKDFLDEERKVIALLREKKEKDAKERYSSHKNVFDEACQNEINAYITCCEAEENCSLLEESEGEMEKESELLDLEMKTLVNMSFDEFFKEV